MTPVERPSIPKTATDLELLRRFEPVLCFTRGEAFFPMSVASYVRECSLWAHLPSGEDQLLVKQGDLTLDLLAQPRHADFGTVHYLRFVEPLSLTEAAHALNEHNRIHHQRKDRFEAGLSRLARVGLLPRLLDALFSLTLLLRGRVPAAVAAAAELAYLQMMGDPLVGGSVACEQAREYVYYGRVVRQNGWVVLQYWFFYCYNNWRSGFKGVNDHEADWETINIYLYEENGFLYPEWVAYANHDFHGDDLRRRWDDIEELTVVDGHPFVFVGAGSHASYFRPGEYQAEVNLPLPNWVNWLVQAWRKFWTDVLDQPVGDPFRIPFVDYARGDGLRIGTGGEVAWAPVLIDDSTPWVARYRGLWGLYARDPIAGENAPAGPMYNRDGTPRSAWYDPLGFAGLDKVPPPPELPILLTDEYRQIRQRQETLSQQLAEKSQELLALGALLKGMEGNSHLLALHSRQAEKMAALSKEVHELRRTLAEDAILLADLQNRLQDLQQGAREAPRAHIRHLAKPVEPPRSPYLRLVETWASLSLGLLLASLAMLLLLTPAFFLGGMLVLIVLFVLIEGWLRSAFAQTLGRVASVLALVTGMLFLIHFWRQALALLILGSAFYLLSQHVRELRWRKTPTDL